MLFSTGVGDRHIQTPHSRLTTMPEHDPAVLSYSHLSDFPRADNALHTLKKVASMVKPIMRARGWKVKQLVEFYPEQQNLLGKSGA